MHTLFSAGDYGYGGSWTLTTDDSGSNTRIIGNYKPQGNSSGTSFIFITVTGGLSSGWNHIAWSRNSDAHRIFVDGTQVGSTVNDSIDLPYDPAQADVGIGIERKNGGASYSKLFKFDDFRLTKGVGRYTSNFTAPTHLPSALPGASTFPEKSSDTHTVKLRGYNTSTSSSLPQAVHHYKLDNNLVDSLGNQDATSNGTTNFTSTAGD